MAEKDFGIKTIIFKTKDSLLNKTAKFIREKGVFFTFNKIFLFIIRSILLFFREFIPLRIMLLFSNDGVVEKNIHGNRMVLDLRDEGISRELALYGVHERQSTNQIKNIVKNGMKILEVGANIGYYALLEGKLAGDSGFVYAIEPSPYNFNLLRKNSELNPGIRMELKQAAFGSNEGTSPFYIAKKSNLSGLIERDDAKSMYTDKIDVDVLTLDNFVVDKKIDLVRMDVEGYEYEVLQGARKMLEQNPPRYFFIEIHSELLHKKNSSAEDIVLTLKKYGFTIIKSFYRGSSGTQVSSTEDFLSHPLHEKGYWETFFEISADTVSN